MSIEELKNVANDRKEEAKTLEENGFIGDAHVERGIAEAILDYASILERCARMRERLTVMTDMNNRNWNLDGHAEASLGLDIINFIENGVNPEI